MKLTSEDIEILEEFADGMDVTFYADYSGRGMYGDTCIGFVTGELNRFLLEFGAFFNESNSLSFDIGPFAERIRTDNMGYDTIVYFPGITAPALEDEEEEEPDELVSELD